MREGQQELRSRAGEIEDMVAAAEVKDADNTKLWDQVRSPLHTCNCTGISVNCTSSIHIVLTSHEAYCSAIVFALASMTQSLQHIKLTALYSCFFHSRAC